MERPILASGRYELLSPLGQGGMACVFKALDTRLKVEKAIKIPNHMCLTNKKIRERFETEAETMAQLHHKNIVIIHDIVDEVYEDPSGVVSVNLIYMVMEMLPGGSLQDRIDEHGLLHPQQAIDAAIAMASGLGYAHERNVVHRDVKLDNVLVGPDNELKVTDFGIAQVDGGSGMTQTGATMGTLAYMAPEQKLSSRRATSLSDLYSVGASLFVMLTNQNPSELYALDIQERAFENLPEAVATLLGKCCHLEPSERYQSADELILALEGLREEYGALPADSIPFFVQRSAKPDTPEDIAKRDRKVNTMWTTLLGIDPDELTNPMPHLKVVSPRQRTNETAFDVDLFGLANDSDAALDPVTLDPPQENQSPSISPSPSPTIHRDAREETIPPSQTDNTSVSTSTNFGALIGAAALLIGLGSWFALGNNEDPTSTTNTSPNLSEIVAKPAQPSAPIEDTPDEPTQEDTTAAPTDTRVEIPPTPPPSANTTEETVVKPIPKPKNPKKPKPVIQAPSVTQTDDPVVEPAVEEAAATFGTIRIVARPWATLTVNGKEPECAEGFNHTPCKLTLPTNVNQVILTDSETGSVKNLPLNIKEGDNPTICWHFKLNSPCPKTFK